MRIERTWDGIVAPMALAAGFFDGVHRGHRRVIEAAVEEARRCGVEAWALTFEAHPLSVIDRKRCPSLLTSTEMRLERLATTGLDGCLLLPFTPETANLSAEAFLESLLRHIPAPVIASVSAKQPRLNLFAGANWHFGKGGAGSIRAIPASCQGRVRAVEVPAETEGGEAISSTRIREAIAAGDVGTATRLMGCPHAVRGTVVHGRHVGRTLGFPTANIQTAAEVMPPPGVYAMDVHHGSNGILPLSQNLTTAGSRCYSAVGNLGSAPTLAKTAAPVLEVHLLDFDGDLYGQTLEVSFLRRLRDEQTFPSREALITQIKSDIYELTH
ncbi:MAG: riboflavin biosynthesis protein RibF [Kiritimatiellaeota bacterium]|nr:riboflavin biosynthesis protein RibF [Kiritimatiellota bacterium]